VSSLLAVALLWIGGRVTGQAPTAAVNAAPDVDWSSFGRDASEAHYSPLKQVDSSNAARLGLAFAATIDAPQGNNEATPIMVNGAIYSSLAWGVIVAFDARTGASKWRRDPELPRTGADRPGMCCGAINRGVAFANGKIFAGLINGRLVALDANTESVCVFSTFPTKRLVRDIAPRTSRYRCFEPADTPPT
jgi:glucose dehydrogenase